MKIQKRTAMWFNRNKLAEDWDFWGWVDWTGASNQEVEIARNKAQVEAKGWRFCTSEVELPVRQT